MILGICIWIFGHRQFGGFDHSALIDTGWRLYSGQRPYQDFVLTTPPAFYLGAWLALSLWGVKWSAFVAVAALFSIVTFILHVMLLRQLLSWRCSLLLALTCQALTMVVTSYWWYNAITSITVCLFLTAALVLDKDIRNWQRRFWFCLCLTFLLLAKPNMAAPVIVLVFMVLLAKKEYRLSVFALLAGSTTMATVILFALRINPLDILDSYLGLSSSRGLPSLHRFIADRESEAFVSIPLILLCLLPFTLTVNRVLRLGRTFWKSHERGSFLLILTGLVSGALGFLTNQDSSLVDLSIVCLSGSLLTCIWLREGKLEDRAKIGSVVATAACAIALIMGILIRTVSLEPGGLRILFHNTMAVILFAVWGIGCAVTTIMAVTCLFVSPDKQLRILRHSQWSGRLAPLRITPLSFLVWITCSIIAFYAGAMRWRVMYIGPNLFYADTNLVQSTSSPFFSDFYIAPRAANVVDQLHLALQEQFGPGDNWHNASVFFGPRLVFGYAAFGIQSTKYLPVWWHPDNSFPRKDTQKMIDRFLAQRYQACIFLIDPASLLIDFSFIPEQILQELDYSYKRIDYKDIVVFERRH